MGEALNQLSKIDSETVSKISDYRKIISFRNVLIHGYADVDNRLVWDILATKFPSLINEVEELLS